MTSSASVPVSDQLTVVAIGNNSLTQSHQVGTIPEQRENSTATCQALAELIGLGHKVVVTHANGPQIGNVLQRVELASKEVYRLPMDICGADTQGGIGYMLQQILGTELRRRGFSDQVATLVTQVRVDLADPAFESPNKAVGPFIAEQDALKMRDESGWSVKHVDSRGWRRFLPSPKPLEIVELPAIRALIAAGITTICTGGGGVPVYRHGNDLVGLEAVIDKDRATALLARLLCARTLIISTSVPQICVDFDTPKQRAVDELTLTQARRLLKEGQFPADSMRPKVEAAIAFLEGGGQEVLITNPQNILPAIKGSGGTWILPDPT